MTLAQAYERVPWHMYIDGVITITVCTESRKQYVCEVCGNEFGRLKFVVVADPDTRERYYIDIGDKCARDLDGTR